VKFGKIHAAAARKVFFHHRLHLAQSLNKFDVMEIGREAM